MTHIINKESLAELSSRPGSPCVTVVRGKDVTCVSASAAEETMFTNEASESLRSWIEKIANSDFDDIASTYTSDEADCDGDSEYSFESDDLDLSDFNIKELSNEDDWITYKNGNKYIGSIEERIPHGHGQLNLSNGKILRLIFANFKNRKTFLLNRGRFFHGRLCGVVTEIDPQDGSVTEILYEDGVTSGTYRHKRLDGQLMSFGNTVQGVKVRNQFFTSDQD